MSVTYLSRNGFRYAIFVRYLEDGECGCNYDSKVGYFVDGRSVFKKIGHEDNG